MTPSSTSSGVSARARATATTSTSANAAARPRVSLGAGRPERRDCRDGREPRSQQRRRERPRTGSRTGRVRDGEGREHEQRNPAERAGRLEPLQDRPGGEQHRHDGGRERELDGPPERHAPEELQQGGRRILSSCERSLSHPERIVPDETEPGIVALHLKRYEFARPYCVGKHVLDAGCGVGYGSAFLSEAARSVVGVDVSADAIEYARARYGGRNVEFAVGDLQRARARRRRVRRDRRVRGDRAPASPGALRRRGSAAC